MAEGIMGHDVQDRILLGTSMAAVGLALALALWRLFASETIRENPEVPGMAPPRPNPGVALPAMERNAPSALQMFLFSLVPQGGDGEGNRGTPAATPPLNFVPQETRVVSSNFYRMLNEIYYRGNAQAWIGATFTVTGMCFRDIPSLGSNRAVIGRYVVSCCAADASVAGFIVEGPQSAAAKQESWVTGRGVLQWREIPQGKLPVIILEELKTAHAESPFLEPVFAP